MQLSRPLLLFAQHSIRLRLCTFFLRSVDDLIPGTLDLLGKNVKLFLRALGPPLTDHAGDTVWRRDSVVIRFSGQEEIPRLLGASEMNIDEQRGRQEFGGVQAGDFLGQRRLLVLGEGDGVDDLMTSGN